jgi:hypothetical protein
MSHTKTTTPSSFAELCESDPAMTLDCCDDDCMSYRSNDQITFNEKGKIKTVRHFRVIFTDEISISFPNRFFPKSTRGSIRSALVPSHEISKIEERYDSTNTQHLLIARSNLRKILRSLHREDDTILKAQRLNQKLRVEKHELIRNEILSKINLNRMQFESLIRCVDRLLSTIIGRSVDELELFTVETWNFASNLTVELLK